MNSITNKKGKVYLVGAGPGDPQLITVRGAELLKTADCIIIDKLANPALLKYARSDAQIIHTPKGVGPSSISQEQINNLMIERALAGKTVVRLKGGDPCIFGRVSEETAALLEAGIDFEIVPGITAAIAASAYTGILLTDRKYSSQVIFVTGQEAEGKQQSNIDWPLLAKFKGPIVFYMAVGNLSFIVERLITNGIDENTSAAVIADVTLPTQKIVKSSISKILSECSKQNIEPPAVLIIGTSAQADERLSWFMKKSLFGKTIVLTRDRKGNNDFAMELLKRGANPILFDTIEIKSLTQNSQFLKTLSRICEYRWIIFTSANGVEVFFDSLSAFGKDVRIFSSAKIAAVGPQTAAKLLEFGIKADFVPDSFTTENLGRQLIDRDSLKGKKVLLLRSALADNQLAQILSLAGAFVEQADLYTVTAAQSDPDFLIEIIEANRLDWLTFASSSSVRFFFEKIPAGLVSKAGVKIASIGPVTSQEIKNFGIKIDIEAAGHTIGGLIEAIENTYH